MPLYFGVEAPYTGLCLTIVGETSAFTGGGIAAVSNCLGGTYNWTNYINPSQYGGGLCNWEFTGTDIDGNAYAVFCEEQPLVGSIGHQGSAYSIFDATSTMPLGYTVVDVDILGYSTEVPFVTVPFLELTQYANFFTDVGYATQSYTSVTGLAPPTQIVLPTAVSPPSPGPVAGSSGTTQTASAGSTTPTGSTTPASSNHAPALMRATHAGAWILPLVILPLIFLPF